MTTRLQSALAILLLLLPVPALAGYPDPMRKQNQIDAFEQGKRPSPGQIVVTGSSSIRIWRSMSKDLKPAPIIARGVSGTTMKDLAHYLDELVLQYRPKAVVIYQGDNDTAMESVSVEQIMATFEEIVARIQAALPSAEIYIMSVKPSLARWSVWSKSVALNRRFAARAETLDQLHYIDIATRMLTADGRPRSDLFVDDGLHMNAQGYRMWSSVLRPILTEHQAAH